MVERLFAELPENYRPGVFTRATTFYFSVETSKKTVRLTPEGCRVAPGRPADPADCVCKLSAELLLRIWYEGYEPGIADFLSGRIRSNAPALLRDFLVACGKSG